MSTDTHPLIILVEERGTALADRAPIGIEEMTRNSPTRKPRARGTEHRHLPRPSGGTVSDNVWTHDLGFLLSVVSNLKSEETSSHRLLTEQISIEQFL